MPFHCFARLNYLLFQDLDSVKAHMQRTTPPPSNPLTRVFSILFQDFYFSRGIFIFIFMSQISRMELFVKKVNSLKPLNVFTKSSIFDIWQGSKYASVLIEAIKSSFRYLKPLFLKNDTTTSNNEQLRNVKF